MSKKIICPKSLPLAHKDVECSQDGFITRYKMIDGVSTIIEMFECPIHGLNAVKERKMNEEICKICGKLATPHQELNIGGNICQDCNIEYRGYNFGSDIFALKKIIERIEKLEKIIINDQRHHLPGD